MDDILASIRRILDDEPTSAGSEAEPISIPAPTLAPAQPLIGAGAHPDEHELLLDESMLAETPAPAFAPAPPPIRPESLAPAPPPAAAQAMPIPLPRSAPAGALLNPEVASSTASTMASLIQAVASERSAAVYHGGPTVEDIVREELRPLLKQWLDANLPPLVERVVRAEIERVVSRAAP